MKSFLSVLAAFGLASAVASPALAADGRQLYLDNCAACHQATGKGVSGAFPALAASKVVVGDPKEPITRVLNGRGGMPAFQNDLSDTEVAAILTYVRASWGNKAAPIGLPQVVAFRSNAKRENARASLQAH
jgi:hypothetical protein